VGCTTPAAFAAAACFFTVAFMNTNSSDADRNCGVKGEEADMTKK